jgi:hypothetical protein
MLHHRALKSLKTVSVPPLIRGSLDTSTDQAAVDPSAEISGSSTPKRAVAVTSTLQRLLTTTTAATAAATAIANELGFNSEFAAATNPSKLASLYRLKHLPRRSSSEPATTLPNDTSTTATFSRLDRQPEPFEDPIRGANLPAGPAHRAKVTVIRHLQLYVCC